LLVGGQVAQDRSCKADYDVENRFCATKGSCTPDVKKLYDSVQPSKRTEHSRKPHEFYDIIETLYDHGRKLEIFARSGRKGWDSVGNEIGDHVEDATSMTERAAA
jgi:N6-adenosine-specific RNA methylase IME4